MVNTNFDANSKILVEAWASALHKACNNLDFDVRCIDWLSYNPDFFIEQKNLKVT